MDVLAVNLARAVIFVDAAELNPRGGFYFPDLVPALVARYQFVKYPEKPEEFDESKGILFDGGRWGNVTGLRFQIHSNLILAETASSTEDSEKLLEDTLTWASDNFHLSYRPGMVKRRAYVSQLTFHSEVILQKVHPAFWKVAELLTKKVPHYIGQNLVYQPSQVMINYDPMTVRSGPAPFTVETRAESPYSENKYFSTAPLPTEAHISVLEALEAEMKK